MVTWGWFKYCRQQDIQLCSKATIFLSPANRCVAAPDSRAQGRKAEIMIRREKYTNNHRHYSEHHTLRPGTESLLNSPHCFQWALDPPLIQQILGWDFLSPDRYLTDNFFISSQKNRWKTVFSYVGDGEVEYMSSINLHNLNKISSSLTFIYYEFLQTLILTFAQLRPPRWKAACPVLSATDTGDLYRKASVGTALTRGSFCCPLARRKRKKSLHLILVVRVSFMSFVLKVEQAEETPKQFID